MQTVTWFDPDFEHPAAPRSRLAVALLIAALVHGALLVFVRFDFTVTVAHDRRPVLEILLQETRAPATDVAAALDDGDVPPRSSVPPAANVMRSLEPSDSDVESTGALEAPQPATDWRSLAERTVREIGAQEAAQERQRAKMWQQTHSVMFAPPAASTAVDEPYLPGLEIDDRRFKGIGFKIGKNCFVGIPASSPENVDTDASDPAAQHSLQGGLRFISCDF